MESEIRVKAEAKKAVFVINHVGGGGYTFLCLEMLHKKSLFEAWYILAAKAIKVVMLFFAPDAR